MISVDDCLLPENVMPPLVVGLYNGVHLFFISGVLTNKYLIVSHYDRPWDVHVE
jgi:hypothetical protein